MFRSALLASTLVLASLPALAQEAQDQPTLTIYTYDAFAAEWGPAPGLKAGFEATCDCTVNFVSVNSSIGALRRVQLEGDTTEADIVLGLDTAVVGEARATGLFAEHSVDTSALTLPNDWSAPDFVPFDYGYFAFIYNIETLPEPPTSFEALAGDDDDLTIVIQDPRSSTPGLGLVLWLKAAYDDDTDEAWAEIAPHVLTVTSGWSEAYNLFLGGEADMVLSYTTSPAYHIIAEEDERFAAAPFSEGHYAQIEVAGILKSSPLQELAQEFLSYMLTDEAQHNIMMTNWMYPVTDIALPKGFAAPVPADEALLLDEDAVTAGKNEWIEEMLGALR